MSRRGCISGVLAGVFSIAVAASASAGPIIWTDWTARTISPAGSASGTMGGIAVNYAGEVQSPTQISCGTNYWAAGNPYTSATVDNAPPGCDIITLQGGATLPANVITFGSAVTNPVMAILSLGQPGFAVTYDFAQPFNVLSFGAGHFGGGTLTEGAGDTLIGVEGHGVIQFLGTFTSISWTSAPS